MSSPKHFNTQAGAPPYKNLYHTVTIVPPNTTLAYLSTQWAADSATGELVAGCEGDAGKQSKIVWTNIVAILKELGAEMKDVVHRTVNFIEFDDEKAKEVAMAAVAAMPDEWKTDLFSSAMKYVGVSHFHKPGIVYAVDLVVAVPNK
ncbi:hypothetical protein N431DRAFT_518124 [Stipitochalara longipes BDJ]|nr:hypothetical protein N431DRAFT_518124 [Stipitochalara longipes BDJ]